MMNTSPPSPRYIRVERSEQLSPHLQRVYFSSDDFSDFPTEDKGAHIKLFFPEDIHLKPPLPQRNAQAKIIWPEGTKPITRTYTIRDFLVDEQLLLIDFVRHADFGTAADWSTQTKPGHILGMAGPGGRARFNVNADYWIFIGDLSALAMIAASLELLPTHAKGQVWIEVEDPKDCIELTHPDGIDIHWLVQSQDVEQVVLTALDKLCWDTMQCSVSLAGENQRVVSLLNVFKHRYKLAKSHLYAVPYWKKGHTEESYHQERHAVMDQV